MKSTAYIRHSVAIVALLLGLALSIRLSERGFLFDTRGALATPQVEEGAYDLQALAVFNRVVEQLGINYVEPERIVPARALVHALDRVQNAVPEVVAIFNAHIDEDPTEVEVRVGAATRTFDISGIDRLWEVPFKLREIFAFLQENVSADEVDLQEVEYEAANGMLSTLDPHTVLLPPRVFSDMQAQNQGEFGGLGIVISIRDNQLTVISPINDTPAARAGFRAGDRIVEINSESTVNMPLDEAVSRLRGPPGTSVTLEVMRSGWTEPHRFELTREQIPIESVSHEALGDGIGYISITNFQQRTHDDMMEALSALQAELGGVRGLVLDLRNNPGGLLAQAVAVSDTFITSGTIVTTVGMGERVREEEVATAARTQSDYPIVVLVNAGSASASEIVAGALKAHNRALVVGETTFGKGSVQVIHDFSDGSALKITVAKYLTPGDVSIQGVGIGPDIHVFPVSVQDDFIDLYAPEHVFREEDLTASLANGQAAEPERPSATLKYHFVPEQTDPNEVEDPDVFEPDFEIEFAREVLLNAGDALDRQALIARATPVVERMAAAQMLDVQERLRTRNVDWTPGQTVIQPVELSTTTAPESGRVHAGDPYALTLSVTNRGDRALHQVRAVTRSDYPIFDDREFVIGRVAPGQTASWTVTVRVPVEDESRLARIHLKALSDEVELGATTDAFVEVIGRDRPQWAMRYQVDDSAGNGDGMLQVGERVNLIVEVLNAGTGAADESIVELRNLSDAAMFLHVGRDTFEELAPNGTHRSVFDFAVNDVPEGGALDARVNVYDTVFRELLGQEIELPVSLAAAAPAVERRAGRATVRARTDIWAGASSLTPVVARAEPAASFPLTAVASDLVRIEWDGGFGWLPSSAVDQIDPVAAPPSAVAAVWPVRPPAIVLEEPPVRASASEVRLTGTVRDDVRVRDFYLVVTTVDDDYRPHSTKFDYHFVGADTAPIEEVVPLAHGTNQIVFVARDADGIEARHTLFVYRDE